MEQLDRWKSSLIVLFPVLAAAIALCFPQTKAAQEAMPSPAIVACMVAPREAEFFETIKGTPVVPDGNREQLINAYKSSDQAATSEQVAALQVTVDQVIACAYAGDYGRMSAVFSDGYWQREVGDLPARASGLASMVEATPSPTTDEDRAAAWVIDARVLPDSRVAALVRYDPPNKAEGWIDLIVFTKVANRWLIDEVVTDVGRNLATPTSDERVR